MNDSEFEKMLRSLKIPAPRQEAQEQALVKTMNALGKTEPETTRRIFRLWRPLGIASGALAAAIVLAVILQMNRISTPSDSDRRWQEIVAQEQRFFNEVRDMFPRNLLAVITRQGDTEIRLSPEPLTVSDQPILVQVCMKGLECVRVLSFSGQTVEMVIDHQNLKFELLVTGSDDVLINGPDFVWTHDTTADVKGLHFKAQALGV